MPQGFNKQTIIGNLAADAELRYSEKGKPYANFRLITNTGAGEYSHTEGFNVVMWGKRAESVAEYLTKGVRVFVEGETRTRSWEDKESGQKRYRTEVAITPFAGSLVLLGGSKRAAADGGETEPDLPNELGEEIPF